MNMMYLAVAAGAYLVLKSRDSGNGKTAMAKNPAFTYPQGTPLTDEQEQGVRNAVLANLGIHPTEGMMQDGSKMTEQIHAKAVSDLNAAMAYYPDIHFASSNQKLTERPLQQILNDLIQYKDQLVQAPEGVGMGPISGFSGVY